MIFGTWEDILQAWRRGEPVTRDDVWDAVQDYGTGAFEGFMCDPKASERKAQRYAEQCMDEALTAMRKAGMPAELLEGL